MKPLETIDEAREAGATHLWVACSRCSRSKCYMLDTLERQTRHRSLDALLGRFRCQRCGVHPDQAWFATRDKEEYRQFEYIVAIWDNNRIGIEQVAVAALSLDEANPAFQSIIKRYPDRWVTLLSRNALLGDSDRRREWDDG